MDDKNFSIPEIQNDSPLEFSDMILRTMETDIESIKRSGGLVNEVHKSAVPIHISHQKKEETIQKFNAEKQFPAIKPKQNLEQKSEAEQPPSLSEGQKTKLNLIIKIVLYTGALIIFFLIGYFVLPKILPAKVTKQTQPEINPPEFNNQINNLNSTSSNQTSSQAEKSQDLNQNNLTSLFKISSDNILEFNIDPQISNFNKYYQFLITDALSETTSTIFILSLKNQDVPLKWADFLGALKINLLEEDFWNSNFNSNFIGFIYKNKNKFLPGYILEIKQNVPLLPIQVKLKNIYENKNNLSNFYFEPTDFSKSELQNSLIFNKEPVTILKNEAEEKFVYGIFFNKYLIFSTSIEGLEQIIKLITK